LRRDVLELDTRLTSAVQRLEVELDDVEKVRLLLSGGSVIDWQRAIFADLEDVDQFLALHLLDMDDAADRERLRYVYNEAVSYLEEHLHLRFPAELRNPGDVREVFLWASQADGFRRRQILSCVILKLMHVIHHMEAADLKFKAPISEARLIDLAEGDILRKARQMREDGLPVVSFYGSRKTRSSVITKLLAKRENLAATVFDKLRFRIVVERRDDLVPALVWLCRHAVPFNYIIPGQSHDSLIDQRQLVELLDAEARDRLQQVLDEVELAEGGKNEFSGKSYRTINFIVDYPVKVPDAAAAVSFGFELGRVVYVMIEFQLLDEETARHNEEGENAHHLYKARQNEVVAKRLKRGRARKTSGD
jgi:uncharacterized protein (TIGR04552 family)